MERPIQIVTLMSPYAVPLSLLLSSCALRVRMAAAGEVAKNKKGIESVFISLLTPFALKIL